MKKKFIRYIALVLSFVCMVAAFSGCGKDNEEKPSVVLDRSDASLDVGDSLSLIAAVSNWSEGVVWASSAESVATVNGGMVTAVAVGSANITATVGSGDNAATAMCRITVTDSGAYPVIVCDYSKVEISVGKQITVPVAVSYKNMPVDADITYTVSDETIAIAEKNSSGNVVITGMDYGETTVIIEGEYLGKPVSGSITVIVKDDTLIEMLNDEIKVSEGKYVLEMNKADIEKDPYVLNEKTINLLITDGGEDITAEVSEYVEWDSSDKSVATVDNGLIKAVDVGNTIISATLNLPSSEKVYTAELELSVNETIITIEHPVAEETTDFLMEIRDATASGTLRSFTAPVTQSFTPTAPAMLKGGNIVSVKIDGIEVLETYNPSDREITLDKSVLKTLEMGRKTVYAYTDLVTYRFDMGLCEYAVTTKQQLQDLTYVTKVQGSADNRYWTGYVMLGTDIDYEGDKTRGIAPYYVQSYFTPDEEYSEIPVELRSSEGSHIGPTFGGAVPEKSGWQGTFDGNGHYIENVYVANVVAPFTDPDNPSVSFSHRDASSFMGQIGPGGVVKNVAFINARLEGNSRYSGFLCVENFGTVENCFISGTIEQGSPADAAMWATLGPALLQSENGFHDCIIELKNPAGTENICAFMGQTTLYAGNRVYAVSQYAARGPVTEGGVYKTAQELKEAKSEIIKANFNSDIWDFEAELITFKSVSAAQTEV